jgi:hypothetical protein
MSLFVFLLSDASPRNTLPLRSDWGCILTPNLLSPEEASRMWILYNILFFHGEDLLAPRPPPKLEDHPLSAVRDYIFNVFTAALHIGDRSYIRNLKKRHAVVTLSHKTRSV